MGTRSTITFAKTDGGLVVVPYVTIYQQYDGYIEGVGHELAKWLMGKTIINGIGFNQYSEKYANGLGCLAAQFIRDFKTDVGGLYIDPITIEDECDYNYLVLYHSYADGMLPSEGCPANNLIKIIVTNWGNDKPIFEGSPKELLEFREE